jgi:3-deoxy-D-manno-octulosonic-acid transferase
MFNFQALAQELRESGAGFEVDSAQAFVQEAYALGRSLPRLKACGEEAQRFVQVRQGATQTTLNALDGLISK